jgi:hypothetical protein
MKNEGMKDEKLGIGRGIKGIEKRRNMDGA